MTRVKAGWAVHGKRPGAFEDYAVLAASSWPCPPSGFKKIIDLHLPGNPPAGKQTSVGGLPWVTFGAGTAPEHMLWVIRQDWTGEADGASRPIVETRLVCARLDDLTVGPLSLRGLYGAARHLLESWEPPDTTAGDAVTLTVPAADLGHLATVVDRFGLERLATVAAAVIDKPVAVVSGENLGLLDRIDLLDAVAALLPSGAKSWLRPGTWTEPAMRNALLRLAFTTRKREDQLRFPLPGEPDRSTSAQGREYQAELVRLAGDRGLETVIKHLAGLTTLTARDPAKVLNGLLELDEAAQLVRDVRDGIVDLDRIRRLDNNGGLGKLNPGQLRVVLVGYLGKAGLGDLDVVRPHWTAELKLYEPLKALVDRVVGSNAGQLADLLQFAGMVGVRDKLLTDLLREAAPRVTDEVIRLIRDGRADPMLERKVAADVTLATRAVLEELNTDVKGVERLVRKLADARHGAPPELLPAVRAVVLADAGDVTGQHVAELARMAPGVTIGLLRICQHRWPARLPRIVSPAVDWLCHQRDDDIPAQDRPAWIELLREAPMSEYDRGRADVLRLSFGDQSVLTGQPRHFDFAMERRQSDLCERARGFLFAARASGPERQELVIGSLAADGTDVWSGTGNAGAVLDFLWRLGHDKTDRWGWEAELARIVVLGTKRVDRLRSAPEFARWDAILRRHPHLQPEVWGNRLAELPADASIPDLAAACAQAVAAEVPLGTILQRLNRPWAPEQIREFVYFLGFNLNELLGSWQDQSKEFIRHLVQAHIFSNGYVNPERASLLNAELDYVKKICSLLSDELKSRVPRNVLKGTPRSSGGAGGGPQIVDHWKQAHERS